MEERIRIGLDENSRFNSAFASRSTKQKNNMTDMNDDKETLISNSESEYDDEDDLTMPFDATLKNDFSLNSNKIDDR